MTDEHQDVTGTLHKHARLVMDQMQVMCVIVDASCEEFRVSVPGVEQYEGDPRMTLVTKTAVYPVKLVRQEAYVGGYAYRLQRSHSEPVTTPKVRRKMHWGILATQGCAAVAISVITASQMWTPAMSDLFPALSRRGLRHETVGAWSPAIAAAERVPSNTPTAARPAEPPESFESHRIGMELKTVSMVSSIAQHRPAEPAYAQERATSSVGKKTPATRTVSSLQSLLKEGQTGRMQPASRELIDWLDAAAPTKEPLAFRVSDPASADLRRFENGLQALPATAAAEAISSLRETLVSVGQDLRLATPISDAHDLFVVACDDANIYFRQSHGQIDLVRVLPIDLNEAVQP